MSTPKSSARSQSTGKQSDSLMTGILNDVRGQVGKQQQDNAVKFAQTFYQRLTEDELPLHSTEAWAALSNDFLKFADKRKTSDPAIRIFTPTQKQNGWESTHTVIQIVNNDMPFLVDSVTMALAEKGIGIHVLGHPVIQVERDKSGKLHTIGTGKAESFMHLEVDRLNAEAIKEVEADIVNVLNDVRTIVTDWQPMHEKMVQAAKQVASEKLPIDATQRQEAVDFLEWAADNHFTFLGYREYLVKKSGGESVLVPEQKTALGLLREHDSSKPKPVTMLGANSQALKGARDVLILTKTNARSTVHRPGYMDYIGVLSLDEKGIPTAEKRFLGLYTSSAYSRRPWDIPLVRDRYEYVMERSGLRLDSHNGKALRHILVTLPRDELFQSSSEELYQLATGILGLQERVKSRLFLRADRYGRHYSALVYVPRERYNTEMRQRVENMLKQALNSDHIDTNVKIGESPLAQLHMIVRPSGDKKPTYNIDELQKQLAEIVRNWHEDVRDELVREHGDVAGHSIASEYGRALPAAYIREVGAETASYDATQLANLSAADDLGINLHRNHPGEGGLRLKFYRQNDDIPLSDALPMIENMGLRVISEHPYRLEVNDQVVYLQDFEVESAQAFDIDAVALNFEEAFEITWRGKAENDGFNRLILNAGLTWRQVSVLRAYCKYLLQLGVPFSQSYVEQALSRYPLLARLLVLAFDERFNPEKSSKRQQKETGEGETITALSKALDIDKLDAETVKALQSLDKSTSTDRTQRFEAVVQVFKRLLDGVSSLDDDRILRSYLGVIDSTLRTNFYQLTADNQSPDYIAFKFDSTRVPDSPKPRPYREIFVYSPRVEGIHLRFGPVARGGLRWSDRREDFRTEVLGLVKAQLVKNTVIVPVGSKGGFYVKQPPVGDRDAIQAEGVACYKIFINALLDITDNLVNGKVVPPQRVVRHDDDDAYLVVAADKGTATFSDIANGIAREHGFWLDDAFASGGSVGYDHKGMGITARGAWESVKRHFRALGRDSQKQDFTAVGIGDMSGDVFGNGMLLSKHIRLVAAFDHRHIFIDPTPDAATSYKERARMFKVPRSSWEDYNKALISKGGGIYSRSAKSIELTAQAKEALGIPASVESLSPNELMSAILKAPVDLLWNGGIGTYVKGSTENNADVGDRANNALRVDGRDLRCKVVGEGGNLGFTQRGRIEAARDAGVLINTDFIDNSAGVDTSDHEVNIKILLNMEVQKKKLTTPARNILLADMTDEVAALVLNDNYRQNQALSLMERMTLERIGSKQHFIQTLESKGLLDRQIEYLPSDAEIGERKKLGQGLTRPELAVLLSYSKLVAYPELLASDVPEDPYLSKELQRYFPKPLQAKYAKTMEQHQLKREIIATMVTNSIINRMGATFLLRMQEDTGRSLGEVAKAYTITRDTFDSRSIWAEIDALDGKIPESVQIDALQVIWKLQRSFTRWLLTRPGKIPDISTAVERYQPGFSDIYKANNIIADSQRTTYEKSIEEWKAKGMPASLALPLAAIPYLEPCADIIELAREKKLKTVDVARVYYRAADAMHLLWLQEQIDALPVEGRWHAVARGVLREDLAQQQRAITAAVLKMPGSTPEDKVKRWMSQDDQSLKFTLDMLNELKQLNVIDYPTASVAVSRLAQLTASKK